MSFIIHHGTPSHSYGVSLGIWITQCYLPPDTSEHTPPSPQPVRPVSIYLPGGIEG